MPTALTLEFSVLLVEKYRAELVQAACRPPGLGFSDSTLTPLLADVCRGPVAMRGTAEIFYYLNFMMCPCQGHAQSMTATFHSKTVEGR